MEDKNYYSELQSALRNFDTKIWAIPGLFFGAVGLVMTNIDFSFDKFPALIKNTIIVFFGLLFLSILLLLFYKAHFFHISIQKKVNKFDKEFNEKQDNTALKRMPITSMSARELKLRLKELEDDQEAEFYIAPIQKWLIQRTVTDWIKRVMWLIFIIGLLFLFSQIYLIIKAISCSIILIK